jgi:hypothetical protein
MAELPATWALGQHGSDLVVHAWRHQNLKPELRGHAFGPEVAVPEGAPVSDRLAGFKFCQNSPPANPSMSGMSRLPRHLRCKAQPLDAGCRAEAGGAFSMQTATAEAGSRGRIYHQPSAASEFRAS